MADKPNLLRLSWSKDPDGVYRVKNVSPVAASEESKAFLLNAEQKNPSKTRTPKWIRVEDAGAYGVEKVESKSAPKEEVVEEAPQEEELTSSAEVVEEEEVKPKRKPRRRKKTTEE